MNISSHPRLLTDHASPRRRRLLDETSKTIYDGPEPGTYVLYFKDDVAVGKKKVITVNGKGVLNNRISELLMTRLNDLKIETHFIRTLNMREQLVRTTETLPFRLTLHNVASGAFARRLGLEEGAFLLKPVPEFSLRNEELNNPVVAAEHLTALGWGRFEEIDEILVTSQRINDFLTGQFLALNIRLMNFTLEFGRFYTSDLMDDSQIVITDEICPDSCSLLDLTTGKRLDRQGVKNNPDEAPKIYQEVARRLGVLGIEIPEGTISTSQDIFPRKKPLLKRSLKPKKNPHGHNSR